MFGINVLLFIFAGSLIIDRYAVGWNFGFLDMEEGEVNITRISIWGSRAFLCIPRISSKQPLTLVEVPWPENSIQTYFNTKPFPHPKLQEIGNCNGLQSAVASDIDSKGKLYVLDNGFNYCSPKIVIYDVRSNKEVAQIELSGVPPSHLSSIIINIDPFTYTTRGYIGDTGENSIIVFNPRNLSWWKIMLKIIDLNSESDTSTNDYNFNENLKIGTSQLTLSKKDLTLYMTSFEESNLYTLDLKQLENFDEPEEADCNIFNCNAVVVSTNFEGNLFGKSCGIFSDSMNGLNYIYERDNVVLRWNTNYPLEATFTEVLFQSYLDLPYPVQLFTDGYQMWAINSKPNSNQQHAVKIKKYI